MCFYKFLYFVIVCFGCVLTALPCRGAEARAVAVIEGWWIRTKNRKIFKILKDHIRSAVSKIL